MRVRKATPGGGTDGLGRLTADVLTLSATPIPRTLHMAMLGLRDISSLTTAPLDRRAIVTEVIPFNPKRVQQAIEKYGIDAERTNPARA